MTNTKKDCVVLQGNAHNEPATELTYLEFTQAFANSKSYSAYTEGTILVDAISAFIEIELKATLVRPTLDALVYKVIEMLYKDGTIEKPLKEYRFAELAVNAGSAYARHNGKTFEIVRVWGAEQFKSAAIVTLNINGVNADFTLTEIKLLY
jgi:hypothetical protein